MLSNQQLELDAPDLQSEIQESNATIIANRQRPELPRELSKYNPFWVRLPRKPLGPPYLGDGKFGVNRMPKEVMEDIRHEALAGKSLEQIVTKVVSEFHLFVHAETVLNHIPKDPGQKFWSHPTVSTPYIKDFEDRNGIVRSSAKGAKYADKVKELYKPFVTWAIENGYGYWQITSLPVAPNTLRMWANSWGYATEERVYTRVPNLTGKQSRTDAYVPGEQGDENDIYGGPRIDKSHKMLGFEKNFRFERPGTIGSRMITANVESACAFLHSLGFDVTLQFNPPILKVAETEVKTEL